MEVTRTIEKAVVEGTVVITGAGELDLHVGKEFDKALSDAVASGKPVTVDFTRAYFVDSAILQSIARHGKAVYDRGERITVLVTSGSHPEYVLKAVGFDVLMNILRVEGEEDA